MSHYNNSGNYYRPQWKRFSFFPPVIKNLLLINAVVFLIQMIGESGFTVGNMSLGFWLQKIFALHPIGGFSYGYGVEGHFYPWQLVTYMFMHGGFTHILFNMFALWMFGMEVENEWGSRNFLLFYLACGIGAALANLFISPLWTMPRPTIGASGGVYGVLVAFGMMFPNRLIFLYFLFPIKAKYFVAGFIALELYSGVMGTMDGVAHFAHLGGAAIAFFWVLADRKGRIEAMLRKFKSRTSGTIRGGPRKAMDATFYDLPGTSTPKEPETEQEVIDRILDKIAEHGYEALTDKEKRILFDASKNL